MKLVFAPDSFKGSLTATQICAALTQAASAHFPDAQCHSVPVADGGEGTVEALVTATGGSVHTTAVTGPMGLATQALWGLLPDGRAVLETAQASGLPLVPEDSRDPLRASSLGTGELLAAVLQAGHRNILLGLGGSATNDGGMGLLCALGARFFDRQGRLLQGNGAALGQVDSVDLSALSPALEGAHITLISDVTNPLLGPEGATAVYGPQKGVTAETAKALEAGMARYAQVLSRALGKDIAAFPGAGAAGGLGAALSGVLGAKMMPGIAAVLDAVGFDSLLQGADLVITGEGRIDGQSIRFGKVPAGVAERCAQYGVPVIALVGGMAEGAEAFYDVAQSSIMVVVPRPMALSEAMENAEAQLADAADRLFRMLRIGRGLGAG